MDDADTAEMLREIEEELDVEIMIVGVHLTDILREETSRSLAVADVVTGCASKHIREQVRPLVQVGTAVPLFGLTKWGKELLIERAKEVEQPLLINTMPLPVLPEHKQPRAAGLEPKIVCGLQVPTGTAGSISRPCLSRWSSCRSGRLHKSRP